jgi:hypothetical protein
LLIYAIPDVLIFTETHTAATIQNGALINVGALHAIT